MDCCAPTTACEKADAERKAAEDKMMNTEVEINGTKLKLSQMFADAWAAKDFYAKLQLMEATKGGKQLLDSSPASIMDDYEPSDGE